MNFKLNVLGLFFIATVEVSSFVVRMGTTRTLTTILSAATKEGGNEIWDELKQHERDLIVQQKSKAINGDQGKDDEMETTKKLVQDMLETALEYVQEQEHIEEEHVVHSRQAFEHAIEEENTLEEFVQEDQLKDVPMDTYLEDRYHAAQLEEQEAIQEEQDALEHYEELKKTEINIQTTLDELKNMEP